jgi:hypothetical protein
VTNQFVVARFSSCWKFKDREEKKKLLGNTPRVALASQLKSLHHTNLKQNFASENLENLFSLLHRKHYIHINR